MDTLDILTLLILLAIVIGCYYYVKTIMLKGIKDVKQSDYIWLKAKRGEQNERYLVANECGIRLFISTFKPVRCTIFISASDPIDFDSNLIEFFFDHVKSGNPVETFNAAKIESCKKLLFEKSRTDF
jgi:hypothetical protein